MHGFTLRSRCAAVCVAAALQASLAVAYQQSALPDLRISEIGQGQPVTNAPVRVSVRNDFGSPLNTVLAIYKGSVYSGGATEISRVNVALRANEGLSVSSGPVTLAEGDLYSACIDPDRAIAERNDNNNCTVGAISKATVDLSVNPVDMSITPVGANVGEPMKVSAMVRNKSALPTRALLRLSQGHPNAPQSKILGQQPVTVAANGSAVANWTIVRPPGDSNLFVSVENVLPREIDRRDNLAARNLFVKAIIDTGRLYSFADRFSTTPAIGDLFGTGSPVLVFGERVGNLNSTEARLTVIQVNSDGTTKEVWSKRLGAAQASIFAPVLADIDGDGSPEIVVTVPRDLSTNTTREGEINVFALDKNGNEKWKRSWRKPGRTPCKMGGWGAPPSIGDMNRDGIADVVVFDEELVILDGRNGADLQRKPLPDSFCNNTQYAQIADIDGDGTNEFLVGSGGVYVFNSDGTQRFRTGAGVHFALLDVDKDGRVEIVAPIHRQRMDIYNGQTGALKKTVSYSGWGPWDRGIAATTSLDPAGSPHIAIGNNDSQNGTALLDAALALKWFKLAPAAGVLPDNPQGVVLADLLGQGRPQVISRSPMRSFGVQDILTGEWLIYTQLYGFGVYDSTPIPVDVDGDGRGEIIVNYSKVTYSPGTKGEYEPEMPAAHFLVFGSEHWKKLPITWNSHYFVPGQVDRKLAFRHDYQPWKTHNTWMQQPLRMPCDIDYDDDVDSTDISLIFSARNQTVKGYDPRDFDKDGVITTNDSRACSLKCTKPGCAVISQPGRILSVSPRTAFPGSSVQVTIRGEFVNLKPGITRASFGPGISVGGAAAGSPGPVTVVDAETAVAQVAVASGTTGSRPVSLITGDVTVTRQEAFALSSGNRPPVVSAGRDHSVVLPATISLSGTAADDGLPNGRLQTSWQAVGGPAPVQFSNPDALATTARFTMKGYYHLRLTASDGQYFASSDIGVLVAEGNEPPVVSAGPDVSTTVETAVRLAGQAHDDGMPAVSSLSVQWSKVSGPGSVVFDPPNQAGTSSRFSQAGTYVVRLTGTDGTGTAADDATVTVNPPAAQVSIAPASAVPGQKRTVTLTGKFTHFVNGQTEAHFGAGISVGGAAADGWGRVTVVDATTAMAELSLASGAPLGARTVQVRTGTELATKSGAFTVGTPGVPHSIRIEVSKGAVAPGSSIQVRPETLDAAGNVLPDAAAFTLTVTPKPGLATGSAPVVNGLTVSFPKLSRRLVNQDTAVDPAGEFADGDPSDPNYGKETGGLYTLKVSLQGSAVTGTRDVAVIPSGTAHFTLRVDDLNDRLDNAIAGIQTALAARNVAGIAAGRAALQDILNSVEFSPRLFAANNVVAPPNGSPVTLSQVASRFPASPDDETFGKQLNSLIAWIRQLRAKIDSLSAATLTPESLETLRAAANTYRTLSSQLQALNPGPVGVTRHASEMNELFRIELPALLLSISGKSVELLGTIPGVQTSTADFSIRSATVDPGQIWDVFSNLFSIFTDIDKYTKANILELAISLANDLVNIAIANLANAISPGGVTVDFVAAGGQFSFVCPGWLNTYVEGTGFSASKSMNTVAVIGCINSYAIRSLLTLSKPKDLAAGIRLISKIKAIAQAAMRDMSIASIEDPAYMREGLFGGGLQMVFPQGWARVNQGRLPCVGVVIAFNLETGSFHAVNANLLPECR